MPTTCPQSRFEIVRALLLAGCGLLLFTPCAPAADWMFRRSYHSHAVVPVDPCGPAVDPMLLSIPAPASRSAYRPAFIGTYPGFAIRSGYRVNRITMFSGNSLDQTIIREGWVAPGP